ncbi:hypothetical protein GI364_08560 [Alicyclobacillus sp. SO9]|nr:hypothetical protein GI364_08560 [Alicyclobacillus sp. SO9]
MENLPTRAQYDARYTLANWEVQRLIDCVTTQNVDGFYQAAGRKEVYELNRSIRGLFAVMTASRCTSCKADGKGLFRQKGHRLR